MDSSSDVEFNENLLSLNDVWIEREIEARETRNPQFYEWFSRYHAKDMKTKMLRNFRHSLGIGDKEFTTNANESINAKIKEKVNYKANELSIFCLKMKELVEEQRKDIERAFAMDCGPYRVKKEFKYLMKQPSEWVKMSRAAREKHINKINSASIIALQKPKPTSTAANIRESTDGINATNSSVDDQENMKLISLSPQECGLPSQIFSSIWKKASQLITKKGMIVDAPGCENVKVVASYTSAQPHFVRFFQNGKLTCDCQNNASLAVCSHTVAVADNEGCLTKLVEWYQKSKQTTNLWALSKKTKVPKKPGAKPHQASGKKKSVRLPVQSRHSLSFEQVKSTPASRIPLIPHLNYLHFHTLQQVCEVRVLTSIPTALAILHTLTINHTVTR